MQPKLRNNFSTEYNNGRITIITNDELELGDKCITPHGEAIVISIKPTDNGKYVVVLVPTTDYKERINEINISNKDISSDVPYDGMPSDMGSQLPFSADVGNTRPSLSKVRKFNGLIIPPMY